MAALMANSVSEERIKIYKSPLFPFDTYISYRLKDMLEPGQKTGQTIKRFIRQDQNMNTTSEEARNNGHIHERNFNMEIIDSLKNELYFASETFLSITIDVPRSFTIRSSFGKLKATV